jgi:TusA-related sulfurtransferase
MGNETIGSTALRLETAAHPEAVEDGGSPTARRFVDAIAARDYKAIYAELAPAVRSRYFVPKGPGQLMGAADVTAKYMNWFGDAEPLEVQSVSAEPIADRTSVRYRFLVRRHGQWEVIEQQTFLDIDEQGRIAQLDLLCSGFRPAREEEEGRTSTTHRFDAGNLGCADGLAQEFRRRILAIPPGDALEVETIDPAAKEDLPPLARMMGHSVLSVEPSDGGRLLITVERAR